jgi:surface polysaccharide O-acyltransferase-like enzyme
LGSLAFVVSCAAASFLVLAVFVRFVNVRTRLSEVLRENAYGIYLVHFPFVNWLGYTMLPLALPAVAKGAVVFVGAAGASLGTSIALRRVPVVARTL